MKKNKVLIFVTFGTSYLHSYETGIFPFLEEGKEIYGGEYDIELCFTSKKVINEIRAEEIPIKVKTLEELSGLEYEEALIYPLYLIEGREYGKIKGWANSLKCEKVMLKEPLLVLEKGKLKNLNGLLNVLRDMENNESGVILIGHGSKNGFNESYEVLRNEIEKSKLAIRLITLEEEMLLDEYLAQFKEEDIRRILLVPFLMVLGYHFNEDINKKIINKIKELGFEVDVINKPLGSNKNIRKLFIN